MALRAMLSWASYAAAVSAPDRFSSAPDDERVAQSRAVLQAHGPRCGTSSNFTIAPASVRSNSASGWRDAIGGDAGFRRRDARHRRRPTDAAAAPRSL